jgi:hypothetical protein
MIAWLLLELLRELPAMPFTAIINYTSTSLLLPNLSRPSTLRVWLVSEALEHLLIPVAYVSAMLTVPILFEALLFLAVFTLSTRVLGEAQTEADTLKAAALGYVYIFTYHLPDLAWKVNLWTGIPGALVLASSALVPLSAFLKVRK